ncbi:MAG TPA: DUF3108 domain-containing protein [Thermoanaerobaculia bacterium]|nr:DUF3108 domain-containing protein [Thermoanaerobaculia bacterium]
MIVATALAMAVSASAFASDTEAFRYTWRLRGGVRFLAGLVFPTNGVANLQTQFGDTIHSELLITAPNGKQGGYYSYESDMDERGAKTLMTFHGYAWGKKARNERTVFDHQKGLARIHKQTPEETDYRVKKLPASSDQVRDILTAIVYLRQNAATLSHPVTTTIYSDGKEYPVVFKPGISKVFTVEGKSTFARAFHIVDAPGGKKWEGGVTVWLTNDDRRVPVRIEIQQSMASLQLDLLKIESSTQMAKL